MFHPWISVLCRSKCTHVSVECVHSWLALFMPLYEEMVYTGVVLLEVITFIVQV